MRPWVARAVSDQPLSSSGDEKKKPCNKVREKGVVHIGYGQSSPRRDWDTQNSQKPYLFCELKIFWEHIHNIQIEWSILGDKRSIFEDRHFLLSCWGIFCQ